MVQMFDGSLLVMFLFIALCFLFVYFCDMVCSKHCNDVDDDEEIIYENLSSERRLELDNLRSRAILSHLSRFALLLKMENMLKKPADSESSSSMVDDSVGREEGKQNNADDVEMGDVAPTDSSAQMRSPFTEDNDDSEYTHVLIPRPGHAISDNVTGFEDCRLGNKKEMRRISLSPISSMCQDTQDINNGERGQGEEGVSSVSCTTDEAGEVNDTVDEAVTEERAVPIFCAICLTKYEISDRVCWSSNSECSHMFHEDCMLRWLVALGRKRSKRKRFSANPSERKMLDYELTCPCCRQDFISRDVILGTEENV